jgi:superfamily II DNA or RNA helicase
MPAYKLGRWDGKVNFCDIGGRSYLNLLDKLLPVVQNAGYEIDIIDNRIVRPGMQFERVSEDSYSHLTWPKGHVCEGEKIMLRDYQVEIINHYLENAQGIQSISTGAGKTLVTAVLSHRVETYGRTIVIVPSKDLVTQTERDYRNLGLDVGVFFGDRKEYYKKHTICTWQSLEALNKKSKYYDPAVTIEDFIDDVVCVIVDEAHGAKADVLRKLMTSIFANVPLRWGMTGTIPDTEYEAIGLIAAIGPIINTVAAKTLQDKGVLAELHVNVLQTQEPVMAFKSYAEELKWLVTNQKRMQWLAKHIIDQSAHGNILVLVDRKATGEMLQQLIPGSVYIHGAIKSKDRKEEYDEVRTSNDKVIIATFGVAAVGIDVPRIFSLYLLEPGKSFIKVIQSIGRGIRKAKDKDFVDVFDVTSTTKYSKRHLTKRKKFYNDAQYPFTVQKVTY